MKTEQIKEQQSRKALRTKVYAFHILTGDMLEDMLNIKDDLTERERCMANMMFKLNEPLGLMCEVSDAMETELDGLRKAYSLVSDELKTRKRVEDGTATDEEKESIEIIYDHIEDPLNYVSAFESCAKSVSVIPDPLKRDVYTTFLSAKFKIKKDLVEEKINKYRKHERRRSTT